MLGDDVVVQAVDDGCPAAGQRDDTPRGVGEHILVVEDDVVVAVKGERLVDAMP